MSTPKLSPPSNHPYRNEAVPAFLSTLLAAFLLAPALGADPFPPNWDGGMVGPAPGSAVHFAPVAWPAADGDGSLDNGDWVPYTMIGTGIEDDRDQDPSNGGTSPQNYVNISSGCSDLTLPSIFLYFDDVTERLMFRWRTEQIAHTYAVGPNTQPAAAVDPWKSAQWTALIDIDADGFREFAVLVDGSSGTPGEDIDRIFMIYSDTPNNSIDYINDPDIHLLAHNPTAFIDGPTDGNTGNILNFQNSVTPTSVWANGNGETLWDYGTSRARLVDQVVCIEYFIDYQIPMAGLDATAFGGPALTTDTPMCLLFTTANSLNNPLQKDVVLNCDPLAGCSGFCGDADEPAPFGDCFNLDDFDPGMDLGTINQSIVQDITTSGCAPTLTTMISAPSTPVACGSPLDSSIAMVDFYYWQDLNANGMTDDVGSSWIFAISATEITAGLWQAAGGTWDTTVLATGAYLIGVRAEDDAGNVTWSHLTQAEVDAMFAGDFANPSPDPGVLFTNFINSCGTSPSVTKAASVSEIGVGGTVTFTVTVNADIVNPLTLNQIDDFLPAGWTFQGLTGAGTLDASATCPTPPVVGPFSCTFPPAVIPIGGSGTLVFNATAPSVQGTYSNNARALTTQGNFDSNPVEVAVGAPQLSIAKDADTNTANPGDTITYTVTYSNDSSVSVTNTVITDDLPVGLTFVSATGGGTFDAGTRTITWNVGFLGAGDGPFQVSFTATVDSPFPSGGSTPIVNTATIDSDESNPESDTASVFVALPLRVQKSAASPVVAAGANITFTIDYANTGTAPANNPVLTDTVPAGFTFVSASGGGTFAGGVVTWAPPNGINPLPPATSGSVTLTLQATSPFTGSVPSTNTVSFSADGLSPVTDDYDVVVTGGGGCAAPTTYYMSRATGDVGFDGTQELAVAGAPTNPTEVVTPTATVGPGIANIMELARFYEDPPRAMTFTFAGDVSATMFIDKSGSPQAIFRLELFDYDPVTGSTVSLGFNDQNVTGNQTNTPLTFTITQPVQSVVGGHRLLWVLSAYNNHGQNSNNVAFRYDGTGSDSRSDVCVALVESSINKQIDQLSVTPTAPPLQILTYTVQFANPGGAPLTGASITDVLPAGVTYRTGSTQLNGAPIGDPAISGQTLTFASVNGAGDAAGTISAGNTGTLTYQVDVDFPPSATSSTLVNDATLQSTEAGDVSDSSTTNILRPNIVLTKATSATLVQPGDTVTYTLTILNAGTATAATIDLDDTVPVQTWFTYQSCTEDLTNAPGTTTTTPCNFTSPTFDYQADQLLPGEFITLTFDMMVETVPAPPAGITTLDNSFTVSNTTDPAVATSNTVTVTVSTNPNLLITKTSNPAAGPLAAGDTVTYTITVQNIGDADALDVSTHDPIPALTSYQNGTLTYDAVAQTDASGDDNGSFNAGLNRAEWTIGTMIPGASHTMTFGVVLDSVLPNGTSAIDNTSFVTSSNTADKQDDANLTADAAPVFTFTKSAPATLALPLTTLAATVAAVTSFDVTDATLLAVNDYIEINGTDTQITAISGNTLTVSVAISGTAGDPVNPVIPYVIRYRNTGTATATGVTITDPLPANTVFVAANNGGTHDAGSPGTVTWNIGSIFPGVGGSVRFWARPTQVGSFPNTATLSSNEVADVQANATTDVGVLEPTKITTTPSVINDGTGAVANYTLTITNNSSGDADNVSVTDTLETGFTYQPGSTNWGGTGMPPSSCTSPDCDTPTVSGNTATWCCWTMDAGDILEIMFSADIAGSVGNGTFQNDISVTSDNVNALDFDFLATAAEDVTVTSNAPNHVVLSRFEAVLGDGGVELVWETDAETKTLGFELFRLGSRGYEKVHEGVLPAAMSRQGGDYRFVDASAVLSGPLVYLLREHEDQGIRRNYGPFLVDPVMDALGADPAKSTKMAGGYSATPRPARETPSADPQGLGGLDRGPGDGLRIAVRENGIHRVAAAELDAALGLRAGEAASMLRAGKMRLSVDDVEVPWISEGQGQAAALLFYGEAFDSIYTPDRIYRLAPERGGRMGNVSGGLRGTPPVMPTYRQETVFEEDHRPLLFGAPEADVEFWFWDILVAGFPGFDRRSFTIEAPGAVAGGTARLAVGVQGSLDTGDATHHVDVSLNGTVIGDGRFRDFEQTVLDFAFDAALLVPGTNTVEVHALLDPGLFFDVLLIDRFELDYERDYESNGEVLAFDDGGHEQLTIGGFAAPEILLVDVSDPAAPREVRGAEITGAGGDWQLHFSPRAGASYIASTPAGYVAPASLKVDRPSDLAGAGNFADYLVITHSSLLTTAERLAAHREARGLVSMMVDIDDVMDEFGGGQFNPHVLRTFLAHAHTSWQRAPRYVALVGEGTVDYKDALGFGDNLLPPLLVVSRTAGLLPSDNRLADVVGEDGVPEMAIGRITARTPQELDAYIDKLVAYELSDGAGWAEQTIFAADSPDATGNYGLESDRLISLLPGGLAVDRIYLGELGQSTMRTRLIDGFEAGASFMSFVGHAGTTRLTLQPVFQAADVALLTNGERAPVVSAMTCHMGNFALSGFPSLGETLVMHGNGGASAVWAASALSFNVRRVGLGRELVRLLSEDGMDVLGDAIVTAIERAAAARTTGGRTTFDSQVLLGDPALLLKTTSTTP